MRTTVTIDDELLAKAKEYTGIEKTADVLRAGIKALVQREAARRLIALQGSEPDLKVPRRRRSRPAKAS